MNRFAARMLTLALVAGLAACGAVPEPGSSSQPSGEPFPAPNLQPVSFTGVADPATGRLQIFMGPQAAIGQITEDADGNAATVTTGTAQVYGASVTFASGGIGYPAGCDTGVPYVMIADVDVRSGFTEQLRNVYARITSKSTGPTFCSVATPGAVAPPTPYVGLYLYQPLNAGAAPSAINRSVQWSMNLPDNSPYWFSGNLWAEVIPQPPTIVAPADVPVIHTGGGSTISVTFRWTNDPLADGSNPEGFVVARPTGRGARLTIRSCGTGPTYDPANCTTQLYRRTITRTSYSRTLNAGTWYQWTIEAAFRQPGSFTTSYGAITTRYFQVVRP